MPGPPSGQNPVLPGTGSSTSQQFLFLQLDGGNIYEADRVPAEFSLVCCRLSRAGDRTQEAGLLLMIRKQINLIKPEVRSNEGLRVQLRDTSQWESNPGLSHQSHVSHPLHHRHPTINPSNKWAKCLSLTFSPGRAGGVPETAAFRACSSFGKEV